MSQCKINDIGYVAANGYVAADGYGAANGCVAANGYVAANGNIVCTFDGRVQPPPPRYCTRAGGDAPPYVQHINIVCILNGRMHPPFLSTVRGGGRCPPPYMHGRVGHRTLPFSWGGGHRPPHSTVIVHSGRGREYCLLPHIQYWGWVMHKCNGIRTHMVGDVLIWWGTRSSLLTTIVSTMSIWAQKS